MFDELSCIYVTDNFFNSLTKSLNRQIVHVK